MKIISITLIVAGIIAIAVCLLYFKATVNPADSDAMTITPSGNMVSEWPLFIGIILTFVGITFFYASGKKSN